MKRFCLSWAESARVLRHLQACLALAWSLIPQPSHRIEKKNVLA